MQLLYTTIISLKDMCKVGYEKLLETVIVFCKTNDISVLEMSDISRLLNKSEFSVSVRIFNSLTARI